MAKIFAHLRLIAGALALAVVFAMATPAPVSAQSGPPAATSEQQLLNQLRGGAISGQVSIPDKKAGNLIHPAGPRMARIPHRHAEVDRRHRHPRHAGAAHHLLSVARHHAHRRPAVPGVTIVRFNAFERFVHWLTATSFVILGLTGLNISFGRSLLLPLMSPQAFSDWSEWAKYVHNFLSFAFTIGVVLMFLMWIGHNFPTAADVRMAQGRRRHGQRPTPHAPAHKFNAGQKLLYWLIVLGGAAMIICGFMLMFPFYYGLNVGDMELSEVFHGVVGVLFISLIIAHIYLGTLGMEGAFESMSRRHGRSQLGQGAPQSLVEGEMQGSGAIGPHAAGRIAGILNRQ